MVWILRSFLTAWILPRPARKEKYPVLRTYQSLTNLIRHTKISYLIASLVFRRFSCGTYRNGLHRVQQGWGTPSASKSTNRVSLISFVGNPHYSILLHRVRYLKIYLCLEYNWSSFSPVSLKSENMDARPQTAVLFCLRNICFSENKNLTLNSRRWTNLYLTLNSWRWANLYLRLDSWRWTNV